MLQFCWFSDLLLKDLWGKLSSIFFVFNKNPFHSDISCFPQSVKTLHDPSWLESCSLVCVTLNWHSEASANKSCVIYRGRCETRLTLLFNERSLKRSLPSQSSHIHLIDALMMAYAAEMISVEKVVSSVMRFSNISASKELPYDLEDSMIFWINRVMTKHGD